MTFKVVKVRWKSGSNIVTLPKEFLRKAGIRLGDYVKAVLVENGILYQPLGGEDGGKGRKDTHRED